LKKKTSWTPEIGFLAVDQAESNSLLELSNGNNKNMAGNNNNNNNNNNRVPMASRQQEIYGEEEDDGAGLIHHPVRMVASMDSVKDNAEITYDINLYLRSNKLDAFTRIEPSQPPHQQQHQQQQYQQQQNQHHQSHHYRNDHQQHILNTIHSNPPNEKHKAVPFSPEKSYGPSDHNNNNYNSNNHHHHQDQHHPQYQQQHRQQQTEETHRHFVPRTMSQTVKPFATGQEDDGYEGSGFQQNQEEYYERDQDQQQEEQQQDYYQQENRADDIERRKFQSLEYGTTNKVVGGMPRHLGAGLSVNVIPHVLSSDYQSTVDLESISRSNSINLIEPTPYQTPPYGMLPPQGNNNMPYMAGPAGSPGMMPPYGMMPAGMPGMAGGGMMMPVNPYGATIPGIPGMYPPQMMSFPPYGYPPYGMPPAAPGYPPMMGYPPMYPPYMPPGFSNPLDPYGAALGTAGVDSDYELRLAIEESLKPQEVKHFYCISFMTSKSCYFSFN
jgi:hypothetical protein